MAEYQLKKGRLLVEGVRLTIEDDVEQRWRKNLLLGIILIIVWSFFLYVGFVYKPAGEFKKFADKILLFIYALYTIDFIIRRIVKYSRASVIEMNEIIKHERVLGPYRESGDYKLALRDGKTRSFTLKQEEDAKELVYLLNQHTNTAH